MSRVIAHIDLNAFFVRAEEIKDPSLEGKPVAVAGYGRAGIISTCSYKAREYGVSSGMPTFQALKLCPQLILKDGDYKFYEALSIEFIQYIKSFTNKVQQMSIDECFADFTEQVKNLENPIIYFKNIQKGLFIKTGLKCSIGVSTTKFLAKMGSDLKKPMGLTIIHKKDVKVLFFNNKVGSYFGIGTKSVEKLNKIGIFTIGDLYYGLQNPLSEVSQFYGKYGKDIINHLQGISSDKVEEINEEQKSISVRNTLPYDVDTGESLTPFLMKAFNECYKRFSQLRLYCTGVTISYRYSDLKTKTCASKLKNPTNDKLILQEQLIKIFQDTYKNESIRQIGVIFYDFVEPTNVQIQMSLFDYNYYSDKFKITDLINELNKYIDRDSDKLFIASDLLNKK